MDRLDIKILAIPKSCAKALFNRNPELGAVVGMMMGDMLIKGLKRQWL
jgi:hypothetical protein